MKASIQKYAKALVNSLAEEKDAEVQKKQINNFLSVLRKRKQSKLLKRFVSVFKEAWQNKKGELSVKVVLPYKPNEEEENHIVKELSNVLKKTVVVEIEVDEAVIGGMRIEFSEYVIDGTILKNLEILKSKITYN